MFIIIMLGDGLSLICLWEMALWLCMEDFRDWRMHAKYLTGCLKDMQSHGVP